MANICSNNYRFIFKDEATATKFSDFVAAQVAPDSQGFPGYADTRIIKQAVVGKGYHDSEIRESIYGAYIERPNPLWGFLLGSMPAFVAANRGIIR